MPPSQNNAQNSPGQQIVNIGHFDGGEQMKPSLGQHNEGQKSQQIHQTVPANGHRPN